MRIMRIGRINAKKMEKIVVLADGRFPEAELPLGYLEDADKIICCDGAANKLEAYGLVPHAIVGDMDSISPELKEKYRERIYADSDDQDTNDLTKAVKYCLDQGIDNIVILGATGKREDHTMGNISLLADYAESIAVKMVTDYGVFIPVSSGDRINSYPGQQLSVFSIGGTAMVSSENLKYSMDKLEIENLWMGTLNESTSEYFSLSFSEGRVVVFLVF